jgi:hypothetical protein
MPGPTIYGSTDQAPSLKSPIKPDSQAVDDFHTNSDLDTRKESQHHTLGPSPTQASPGDHTHDGGDSPLLLTGLTISGSRGGNTSLPSIIACLVRLGAKDSSTA